MLAALLAAALLLSGGLVAASSASREAASPRTSGGISEDNDAWCPKAPGEAPTERQALSPASTTGRPNIIFILTDDQGYDDLGLHHPRAFNSTEAKYIRTPNMDRFTAAGVEFDDFYVAPKCSHTRAELLTGRDYPSTGVLLVDGGYDFLNRNETNIAQFLSATGYKTSHFGKWHNGWALGYEPWNMGFQQSWLPQGHVHTDCIFRHNGEYKPTKGLMEHVLMDKILGYLDDHRAAPESPFFMYYATHLIHEGKMLANQSRRYQRPAPQSYYDKFVGLPGLERATAEAYASLNYLDDVLGRLFDYLEEHDMYKDTYVFLTGDNGPELFDRERRDPLYKLVRMPSGMQGHKASALEGGWRQFLAARGPNISAGVVATTLTSVRDLVPTAITLAGGTTVVGEPMDGISLDNLLRGEPATPEQQDRFVITISPDCAFWPNFVPDVGPDRATIKPQAQLDFETGGRPTTNASLLGFERCLGVRYQSYKWLGERPAALYNFTNGSHAEVPCTEVPEGPAKQALIATLRTAGASWWQQQLDSPHSFTKPVFPVSLGAWTVTNLAGPGAFQRTAENITLGEQIMSTSLAGFRSAGDVACFKLTVDREGLLQIYMFYASNVAATFNISVGTYEQMDNGTAPTLTVTLPAQANVDPLYVGNLSVLASPASQLTLLLLESTPGEVPVFKALQNIRLEFRAPRAARAQAAAATVDSKEPHDASLPIRFQSKMLRSQVRPGVAPESLWDPYEASMDTLSGLAFCPSCIRDGY